MNALTQALPWRQVAVQASLAPRGYFGIFGQGYEPQRREPRRGPSRKA